MITQTGVLRGRGRRALDSTILADAVATQDTITQLVAAVRRVARVVPGAGDLVAAVCSGHDYTGHRAVIKAKPLQVAVTGGFTLDDFTVDEQAGTVACPNQITRPISPRSAPGHRSGGLRLLLSQSTSGRVPGRSPWRPTSGGARHAG